MQQLDFAFTVDPNGTMVAHRADCPTARQLAAEGAPVITMIGCLLPLRDEIKRHSCLTVSAPRSPGRTSA
jgi:hypothetical protein